MNQADYFLDLASGDVTTYKISGEDARLHCIACADKFLSESRDGFSEGSALNESHLGSQLWNAAEVRTLCILFYVHVHLRH
jgi:hypothetical protein